MPKNTQPAEIPTQAEDTTTAMQEKPAKAKRAFSVQQQKNGEFTWHAYAKANKKVTFRGESHPTEGKAIRAIKQELTALGVHAEPEITVLPSLFKGAIIKLKRDNKTGEVLGR